MIERDPMSLGVRQITGIEEKLRGTPVLTLCAGASEVEIRAKPAVCIRRSRFDAIDLTSRIVECREY